MLFKCPVCPIDNSMNYITKQHLELHINYNHPDVAKMINKGKDTSRING